MGGNALQQKGIKTRRADAAEYHGTIVPDVLARVQSALPGIPARPVPAYRNKLDFGDLDIVIESDALPPHWQTRLCTALDAGVRVANGPVVSIPYGNFQVDFLTQSAADFDFALAYFAWNDLGNLIGRIARRMGFKFAHDGLWYINRRGAGDSRVVGELPVTKDFSTALEFLGYDAQRHDDGFDDLESVYRYAASSRYFDPDAFPLEHRNHRARVRDRKRSSYTGFLKWLKAKKPPVGEQCQRSKHLERAMNAFPDFAQALHDNNRAADRSEQVKAIYNGHRVAELTGRRGKELGVYMACLQKAAGGRVALEEAVLMAGHDGLPELIKQLDKAYYERDC